MDFIEKRAVSNNKSNFSKLNKFFDDSDSTVVKIKSKIEEKNLLIHEEYRKRANYVDKNYSNLKLSISNNLLIEKNIIDQIKIIYDTRFKLRSKFLIQRAILQDECRLELNKLIECYTMNQELNFVLDDIIFRRKNLSEEDTLLIMKATKLLELCARHGYVDISVDTVKEVIIDICVRMCIYMYA